MDLYVSDLDGTLLNSDAKLSDKSIEYLNTALKNNINFTVATARTPATVVDLLEGIDIVLPVITMNGSAIYDIKNNKYLTYTTISYTLANKIKKIIDDANLNAFVYTMKDDHLFVYHNNLTNPHQINFYNERKDSPYKTFIEDTYSEKSEILYFTVMDSKENIDLIYEKIKDLGELYIAKYKDTYSDNIYNLEIYSVNTSKANAIMYLKQYYHYDKLITFGDNLNDLPMFEQSDECYAVQNAVDELKAISTATIGLNSDDSVAKYILESSKLK